MVLPSLLSALLPQSRCQSVQGYCNTSDIFSAVTHIPTNSSSESKRVLSGILFYERSKGKYLTIMKLGITVICPPSMSMASVVLWSSVSHLWAFTFLSELTIISIDDPNDPHKDLYDVDDETTYVK